MTLLLLCAVAFSAPLIYRYSLPSAAINVAYLVRQTMCLLQFHRFLSKLPPPHSKTQLSAE